jgi:serine/threonine protein kinase
MLTSYRYMALIISPVADCNLREYLEREQISPGDRYFLRSLDGCLAAALDYLHANSIRHGDIKPGVRPCVTNECHGVDL